MLRDLLDAEDLPSQLLAAGIPVCALATVVGLTVIMIASTAQLVQHRRAYRNRFISRDSRQMSTFDWEYQRLFCWPCHSVGGSRMPRRNCHDSGRVFRHPR